MTGIDSEALATEWLLADGRGGFAMGTACGVNARRYHGWCIQARRPPVERILVLHSLIAQFEHDDGIVEWSMHEFGPERRLHPRGVNDGRVDVEIEPGFVEWTTTRDGAVLRCRLAFDAAARIECTVTSPRPGTLRLRPLVPLRNAHLLHGEDEGAPRLARADERGFTVERAGRRATVRATDGLVARAEEDWWRGFHYELDRERGQSCLEDVWSPGVFEAPVAASAPCRVALEATLDDAPDLAPAAPRPAPVRTRSAPEARLAERAEVFVVRRDEPSGPMTSIIAGYPWFTDWGRDSMISLPGLLLAAERHDEARSLLRGFAARMRDGVIPNCFDDLDAGAAQYHTADGSLLFAHAVLALVRATGEPAAPWLDALRAVLDAYRRGTSSNIRVDDDGLVVAGDGVIPVTWMDARRGGRTFTPRAGKPIELSALWHHALHGVAALTEDDAEARRLRREAERTAASIRTKFRWPERACLHDVIEIVDGVERPDGRLRPNQLFAVALDPSPLEPAHQTGVVEACRRDLLTPYGLRTLAPDDSGYVGRYEGDLLQRDAAYHNGTVWPWLIGPFGDAVRRAGDERAQADLARALGTLLAETRHGCIGHLAEIYDGDAPHRAQGCPAQAWSEAEVLRLLAEGIAPIMPED